jgi:DNA-binding transcriptional regulator YhcF (GntR family)
MTLRQRLILALAMDPMVSSRVLAKMTGFSSTTVCKELARMEMADLVKRKRITTPHREREADEQHAAFTWRLRTPSATLRAFGLENDYRERMSA